MKILIFSGSHPRHLYIHDAVLQTGLVCAAVVMQREGLSPSAPENATAHDKKLFDRHFRERYDLELSAFGQTTPVQLFGMIPVHTCTPESLNSPDTVSFVKSFDPDFVFIFGTNLIRGELFRALPEDKVNLHLGLSPWYRGSATLFWPFYFLQPQYAGATFHQIVHEADAGDIIHQSLPELKKGDGIHDVGVRTVITARNDLRELLNSYFQRKKFSAERQTSTGRLFLSSDFHPSHLRIIYDLFDNKLVDAYRTGELGTVMPKVIKTKAITR